VLADRRATRVHLPDHAGVRVVPPLVHVAAMVLGFLLQWLWPARLAHESGIVLFRWLAAALLLLGAWLVASAIRGFRDARTSLVPVRPTTALVLRGPYRYTRNPMYLGLLLVSVAITFAANALWPLLLLPAVIVIINREVIVREEKYLSRKFGGEYEVYKRRTRRWI
jgi:protein-S-isoprenylcysteine O-methyltransferase Ste14